jgi:predicted aldo/keto reductase-like oxidoreductase
MKKRRLGTQGLEVSAEGLGCMGISKFYGTADEDEAVATIQRALDLGVTLIDTADELELTDEDVRRLEHAFPRGATAGDRYADMSSVGR